MKLSTLIAEYRAEHGLSQRKFAEICGLSNGYISMIERNQNPNTNKAPVLSISSLKKIASGMGMTIAELFLAVDDIPVNISAETSNVIQMPTFVQRPRLGTIACGTPILAEQNIDGYDRVPDYIKCDFTLLCKGDSMTGARINDGDIVCIKQQSTVENGQIAAVLINGEFSDDATLKRVRFMDDGIALWPENPNYAPMIFTGENMAKVHILGLATHFISTIH